MIITCDMCKYQDICSTNSECVLVARYMRCEEDDLSVQNYMRGKEE